MKKIVSLLLVIAMSIGLTACGAPNGSNSGTKTQTGITAEEKAAINKNIELWEDVLLGETIDYVNQRYSLSMFTTAFCEANGIAITGEGMVDVADELNNEIISLFFQNAGHKEAMFCYSDANITPNPVSYTRTDAGIEVIVEREMNSMKLCDNKYVFEEAVAPEIKNKELGKLIKKGDKIFRFVSIEHVPYDYSKNAKTVSISTAQELVDLAKKVNSGDYEYISSTFVLQNDIDLSGVDMQPIGTNRVADNPAGLTALAKEGFNAVLDGNGKKISGFSLQASNMDFVGFFSMIGSMGVVKNLTLDSPTVTAEAMTGRSGAGCFAGALALGASVDNCQVANGKIAGVGNVGGFVGTIQFHDPEDMTTPYSITNCTSDAQISAVRSAGGFIGYSWESGVIQNCTSLGSIDIVPDKLNISIGGFVGEAVGDITGCHSNVKIAGHSGPNRMGNFVGELLNADIIGCTVAKESVNSEWYNVGWQHYKTSKVDIKTV